LPRKWYLGLFITELVIVLCAAWLERAPGYMDADYYYAGGLRIASNHGSSEPYLWNYLNAPDALPAPSFSYWMPLVSLLAAGGLVLGGPLGWWGARLGFILLSACIPPLAALISDQLTRSPAQARLAGLLALFPGFYLAYYPTTDAFPIYMVLGSLFVLLSFGHSDWLDRRPVEVRLLGLGAIAGLLHLARADGLLWLAGALAVTLAWNWPFWKEGMAVTCWLHLGAGLVVTLLGYGLVMAPWYSRNLQVWGSLMPPGGGGALWITAYEQTMLYPASLLTPQHWLAAGSGVHLAAWRNALSGNFQTALAVQGSIVLFPFILVGMWKLRGCPVVRLGVGMWLLTAGAMTVIFPFAGMNGGFFHSGAALQPLLWAVTPVGVEAVMLAYARWRKLSWPQGMLTFTSGLLVVVVALLSGLLYFQRVVGSEPGGLAWGASQKHYQAVEQELAAQGAAPGEAVLVNNPPGYWLASGRPAAVVPYGDPQMLLAAARKYQIRYLVLETNNSPELGDLYRAKIDVPELDYLSSVGSTRLYRVKYQK
jgi:hypothetical protein